VWRRRIREAKSNRGVRARARAYKYAWEKLTVGNLTYWWRDGKATPGQNDGWKGIPTLASRGDRRLIFMIIRSTVQPKWQQHASCPFYLYLVINGSLNDLTLFWKFAALCYFLTISYFVNVYVKLNVNRVCSVIHEVLQIFIERPEFKVCDLYAWGVKNTFQEKLQRSYVCGSPYFAYSCYIVVLWLYIFRMY